MEVSTPEGYHKPQKARKTMLPVSLAFIAGIVVIMLANIQWKRPVETLTQVEVSPQATTTQIDLTSQITEEITERAAQAFSRCLTITFIATSNTGDGTLCNGKFCYSFAPINPRCYAPAATSTKP